MTIGSSLFVRKIRWTAEKKVTGDSAFGWAGDHVEPGVSCTADTKNPFEHPNISLQLYSCVGNQTKVISGEVKDAVGYVIGHHDYCCASSLYGFRHRVSTCCQRLL